MISYVTVVHLTPVVYDSMTGQHYWRTVCRLDV